MDSGHDLLGRTEGGRVGESRRDQGWRRRTDLFRDDPGSKELVGSERKYNFLFLLARREFLTTKFDALRRCLSISLPIHGDQAVSFGPPHPDLD